MAYTVYWLLGNGVVKGKQDSTGFDWDLANHTEVNAMMDRNELDLKIVRLYTVPMGNNLHFLIYAYDEQSARGHYYAETGRLPQKIFDITHHLDRSFWIADENSYQSLREMRNKYVVFPQTAMVYEKER